jgi:thiol-disulfide isomerase/thioredoxin
LLTSVVVLLLAAGPVSVGSVHSQGLPTPTPAPVKNPGGAPADPAPTRAIPDIILDGRLQFIEFYADWCGPCIDMRPHINTMESRYTPMVRFWRVDVDTRESDRLEAFFGGVPAIPLLVVLDPEGRQLVRMEGFQSERQLDRLLRELFAQTGMRKPDRPDAPAAGESAVQAPAAPPVPVIAEIERLAGWPYPRN